MTNRAPDWFAQAQRDLEQALDSERAGRHEWACFAAVETRLPMPVRSLSSSVLRWPDKTAVDTAARRWADEQRRLRPALLRLGYFGSYARGDWGVGSDLDLIALVSDCDLPFERRSLDWDLNPLPVPAEILVYTEGEWERLQQAGGRFAATIRAEAVWL